MKTIKTLLTIIGLVFILAIQSCSDDDANKYTSVVGDWVFKSPSAKGEFSINSDLEVYKGEYTIQGIPYSIVEKRKLTHNISLMSDTNGIGLEDYEVNEDYTEMTAYSIYVGGQNIVLKEIVLISRK